MELPRRRLLMLTGLGLVLGLLGGLAAFVLLRLIALITNLALLHRVGWTLPSLTHLRPSIWTVVVAATGGLVVTLLALWSPVIKGHGIPEAMEAVLTKQSRIAPRAAIAKPISAAIAIGTGGPFGAEGPIIVTGGALGSLIGQALHISPAERKVLLASGAAAGMAATFGTPLAAVLLAIELLMFEFSARVFIPLVVASTVAAGVHAAIFGWQPLLHAPASGPVGLATLPVFALLGVACGCLAALITKGLELVELGFERLPIPAFWFPALGGIGFAIVGLFEPRALGVGYDEINDVLLGKLAAGTIAALLIAKLVAWWVALGSGTSGGTLAPLLLIGGSFGALAGTAGHHLFPGSGLTAGAMSLVAMSATFAAATRAPFASMVFLFELTRDYDLILPLMLATVVAVLVYDSLLTESLMTMKLARRGLRVDAEFHVDPMRSMTAGEAMTSPARTIPATASVAAARATFREGEHGAYPIVDALGRLAGIVTRGDLIRTEVDDRAPILDVAARDVVAVAPDVVLIDVLARMLEEDVDHIPVVDGGRTIGMCTRSDLLRVREPQLAHEASQPGWLRARR